MSQASTCSSGGASIEVGATILLPSSKYKKKWRSLYLGFLISVKWPTTCSSSVPTPKPPARTSSSVVLEIISDTEEVKEEEEDDEEVEARIKDDIARIVKENDFKSLHQLGGVDLVVGVLARQRQHSEKGAIDDLEAAVPVLGASFYKILLNSCKCNVYTILMLLISAGLCLPIGFKQEGPKYGWHDGVAILCAVFLLVAGNSAANFWRERKMLKLATRRNKVKFTVKRGEKSLTVPLSNVMVGDMVFLGNGVEVPADGLLVSDEILELAEPEVVKSKTGNPFLISGSKIVGGSQGWMFVTSVGNSMNCCLERRGLLESLIEKPISYMDKVALLISLVITLVVLIRVVFKNDEGNGGLPDMKGKVTVGLPMEALERVFLRPQGRVSILTGLVTVVILSMQHGMPFVVAVSLMSQINKVVSNKVALLNDLSACTTMGLVTVICIDASGGISKPMEVSRTWIGEKDIISKVEGSETNELVLDVLKHGVGFSVLDQEFYLSSMRGPLVSWAKTKWEMNMDSFREKFVIIKHEKLNSDMEGNGFLVREVLGNKQVLHLHWSGPASIILEKCSSYYDSEGERHAMENQKIKFGEVIKEMEDDGLKSIAFAYRETNVEELDQDELILLAVIGLKVKNNSQELIKSALENLKSTNIQIKLVSEDEIMVVKDIACELGIEVPPDDSSQLEGTRFQDLNEKARLDKVDQALIMAGFLPQHKPLLVDCLQKKGHVVAFIEARLRTSHTSDLKVAADVGIVHDSLRTVDRDNFGISIQCFSALKPIVMAGRNIYHNIQKFIQLQLTVTISGLLISLIATISTGDSPLTAFQLIWVNVLMGPLGGLMMVMKLTREEELAKQPSDRSQPIITKEILKSIVIQVLYQVSLSMILEFGGHVTESEKKVRKTMIFNTFLLCQLVNQINTMQLFKNEVWKIVAESYCFLVALCICILMQVMVIEYAKGLSNCMQLNAIGWGICILVGVFSWVVDWALKKILEAIGTGSTHSASQSISSPSFYHHQFLPFLLLLFPLGLIFTQHGISLVADNFTRSMT
ncbi:hypothetical protein VNO77_29608 [Canavalia gladiata]|uniref:Uncharacterized protein n=1 Tax=Canavalia gladiata TaxID=3824 RepID=A0AAN9KMM6_CANGL